MQFGERSREKAGVGYLYYPAIRGTLNGKSSNSGV
jgi:hypothetical protein